MHIETKSLPESIRAALRAAGVNPSDIKVKVESSVNIPSAYGNGFRARTIVVNLATGERREEIGSWGGSNPFEARALDQAASADKRIDLPPGFVALTTTGKYYWLHVHPDNAAPLLPSAESVSPRDAWILGCFAGLTSSGRKDEFSRRGKNAPSESEISALVARGYLDRNKAGATKITTKGRNAAGDAGNRPSFVPRAAALPPARIERDTIAAEDEGLL